MNIIMKFLNYINVRCFFAVMIMLGKSVASELPIEQESLANEATSASLLPANFVVERLEQEYATLDTVFERVIGLGDWCLTKGQVNRYFAPDLPLMCTKPGHADLFDWLFINDYRKFAIALESQLTDFFERENFKITTPSGQKAILNTRYNMCWNHLFDGRFDKESTKIDFLSEEKLDTAWPSIRRKIDYLKDKFIAAKNSRTLYVISNIGHNVSMDNATLIQVRDALTVIRQGDRQFCVLYVYDKLACESTENIIVRNAQNLRPGWDGADPVRWKEILDEFHFADSIWD